MDFINTTGSNFDSAKLKQFSTEYNNNKWFFSILFREGLMTRSVYVCMLKYRHRYISWCFNFLYAPLFDYVNLLSQTLIEFIVFRKEKIDF